MKEIILLTENEILEHTDIMKDIKTLWKERGNNYNFHLSFFRSYKTKEIIFHLFIYKKDRETNKCVRPKKIYNNYKNMKIAISNFLMATSEETNKMLSENVNINKVNEIISNK